MPTICLTGFALSVSRLDGSTEAQSLTNQTALLPSCPQILSRIHPTEYIYYYNPQARGTTKANLCARLEEAIKRFDEESYWVAGEICLHEGRKEQTSMISKFILVADACRKLGNFFSLFTILGALDFPEVRRFKRAWKAVPDKLKRLMAELQGVMETSRNMKVYRAEYDEFEGHPRIPFLPLHLKDLVFLKEGSRRGASGAASYEVYSESMARLVQKITFPRMCVMRCVRSH